jgi:hypothetical protein
MSDTMFENSTLPENRSTKNCGGFGEEEFRQENFYKTFFLSSLQFRQSELECLQLSGVANLVNPELKALRYVEY